MTKILIVIMNPLIYFRRWIHEFRFSGLCIILCEIRPANRGSNFLKIRDFYYIYNKINIIWFMVVYLIFFLLDSDFEKIAFHESS